MAYRPQLVAITGKTNNVDRIVCGPEKVEPAAHGPTRPHKFEIENGAAEPAGKILVTARNVPRQELKLLLLVANDVSHDRVFGDSKPAHFEMTVVAVDEYIFDVRLCRRRLGRHFPAVVWYIKSIFDVRITESRRLSKCRKGRDQRQQRRD